MRQVRELFRLKFGSLLPSSDRQIAAHLGVARSTAAEYLERARAAGLSWPLPLYLSDADLEERLFARPNIRPGTRRRPEPNWVAMHRELRRPGATLMILWEEYRATQPEGYAYSRFCELYRAFETRLAPSMRQTHLAGGKVFVDHSGKTLPIRDPVTGAIRPAQLFIAVLGASNCTYAEATWTQTLPDWIGAHVRMLEAFQGCPRLIVPDNLKSGVLKVSFYDPELNRTYAHMAQAYGVGILPARPRRPRDKAKVEAGVRVAQYFILGRLRNVPFFSLADANGAIGRAPEDLNTRPQRRLGLSRQ
ncbi:IS21 family transposase [Azospirillum sp. B21]|uniref:IS21 family transposase n=1 Tax=Azospirillum sp. B21 TaxID=2607496 RepID=UPI00165FD859|nr:IS21 family transposase [Azospirillum sp. B21]